MSSFGSFGSSTQLHPHAHQVVEDVVWAKVCEMCTENHLRPIYFLEVVLETMGEDIAQRLRAEYKYRNGSD